MDYIDLGNRIKKKRLEKNLTQEALAEMSKISCAYIGQIERGEKGLSLEVFLNIANALNCSTDELLRKSTEENINSRLAEIEQIIEGAPSSDTQKLIDVLKILFD